MINLMADPERFKWQSPVTKCKKTLDWEFGTRDCNLPMRKQR